MEGLGYQVNTLTPRGGFKMTDDDVELPVSGRVSKLDSKRNSNAHLYNSNGSTIRSPNANNFKLHQQQITVTTAVDEKDNEIGVVDELSDIFLQNNQSPLISNADQYSPEKNQKEKELNIEKLDVENEKILKEKDDKIQKQND